jgi:REP element-mobilizing transposase RayT
MLLAFIPIGIWELYDVIKKKYHLLVVTDKKEKITFREKTTKAEPKNFLEQAKENFGYEIEYSNLKPDRG